jgi:hypothetical protein
VSSTRRDFLQRAGALALGASGIYELADAIVAEPASAVGARARTLPPEQHLLGERRIVRDNGIDVVVPALHHQIVTANLRIEPTRSSIRAAQAELEAALRQLEQRYRPPPTGLGVVVAWGLSYFTTYVPMLADSTAFPLYLPVDKRASLETRSADGSVFALTDAIAFPSDPPDLILEQNDVVFHFESDHLDQVSAGAQELVRRLDGMFELTSVRKGFVGGGFGGGRSLPKRIATAAGVPGAASIPESAELFLGFTSTQHASLGSGRNVNFETVPGLTDQWPNGYFRHGTTMHLSHIFEDLERWYSRFDFTERVERMFRPGLNVKPRTLTVSEGPRDLESLSRLVHDGNTRVAVGHSASMQPANRVRRSFVDNYGVRVAKGAAILQRADFNTVDNPFFWTAQPAQDRYQDAAVAGLHFVAFAPTSDTFTRVRLAMDGHYPDGTTLPTWWGGPHQAGEGFNAILKSTHRQNFLVPPRRHRSFPLAERV